MTFNDLKVLVKQIKESMAKFRKGIIIVMVLSGLILLVKFIELVLMLKGGK